MLTVDDIRNPKRKSGFDYVRFDGNRQRPSPFRGVLNSGGTHNPAKPSFLGEARVTAEEAAQDYCDYINSGQAHAPKPQAPPRPLPRMLNHANHPKRPKDDPRRSTVPISKRRAGEQRLSNPEPGFVYLIGIEGHAEYVKIGWSSSSGFSRLNELQTGNPLLLVGLAERPGTLKDEYTLHCRYEIDNVLGEWFQASLELLAEFDLTWNQFAMKVKDMNAVD